MTRVMIFGTFDILHAGHLYLFKQAKKYGNHLTVVIARDTHVKKIKDREAVHTENERAEMLRHMDLIDKVILGSSGKDVYSVIKKEKPDLIVLGYDQNHFVDNLQNTLKEFGLATKIKRVGSHKKSTHKSGKIREKIIRSL